MKYYPWLKDQYHNILKRYLKNILHPIILINSQKGVGISQLIIKISQWLLCSNKKNIKFCKTCNSCILIKKKNHPDLYYRENQIKKKKTIGIDYIRNIIININKTSQQGGKKIVWLKDVHYMTIEANNALLKTLEEPPKNTFFFVY